MKHESYDVLIIGSGLGGLCAGALLAHAGLKTLVVETLPVLGGRLSTRKYRGYTLSTGGFTFDMGGAVGSIVKEVGAEPTVRPVPTGASFHINGQFCEIPGKGKLAQQVSMVAENEQETMRVMSAIGNGIRWLTPSSSISLREWLLQYSRNERILGIFQGFISGIALINADELPASEFFRLITATYAEPSMCPEGNINLMRSLADVIQAKGGGIRSRCPAQRILVENGAVTGAMVGREGEEVQVSAEIVISNAGPKMTVELAGPEHFDKGYLKQLKENNMPAAISWMYISSDKPLVNMETPMITVLDAQRINLLYDLTSVCPEWAPKGKYLIGAGASPASTVLPVDLEKELEICVQDLREIIPDFDGRAEIILTQYFRKAWPGYRAWPGRGMPEKTPILNLYNVGDGVFVPALIGTANAAQSARIVAEDVKKRHMKGNNDI